MEHRDSRVITLFGEVTDKGLEAAEKIILLSEKDREDPIELHISSAGGEISSMFALIGVMEAVPCEIRTYAYGDIWSAAFPVFLAGDKRACHRFTRFMYHNVLYDAKGSGMALREHKDYHDEVTQAQQTMNAYIVERTAIKRKTLEDLNKASADWYFGAEEALKLKVVDRFL